MEVEFDLFNESFDYIDWLVGINLPEGIKASADGMALDMAWQTRDSMSSLVHVGEESKQKSWDKHVPGRLRNSIRVEPIADGEYMVIADAEDNRGGSYAMTELGRGDMHNFASILLDNKGELVEEAVDHMIAEVEAVYMQAYN